MSAVGAVKNIVIASRVVLQLFEIVTLIFMLLSDLTIEFRIM